MLLKIDSIMYYVRDLEEAAQFYQDVLGLRRVWTDEEQGMMGFIFPEDRSEIVIHNDSSLPNPYFSFCVENVEKFCEHIHKRGYTVLQEPFDVRCGKFAVLADPEGNEIPIIDLTKFAGTPRYDNTP